MFDRLSDSARQVVARAEREARALGHGYVGTEHLLLGLLLEHDSPPANVLRNAGITHEQVRDAVESLIGRGTAVPDDAAALRSIGIDLEVVRATVEAAFGPGALEPLTTPTRRLQRVRRRCGYGAPRAGDHIPLTPRTKKVLELALRESLSLRQAHIGSEHILLGLLREGEGVAAAVLVQHGVPLAGLRHRVLAALGKVA